MSNIVQSVHGNLTYDGITTPTLSFPSNVTAGNLIAIFLQGPPMTDLVITDTQSNTWNEIDNTPQPASYFFYAMNTIAGATTVSFSGMADSNTFNVLMSEIQGCATTSALDVFNFPVSIDDAEPTFGITTTYATDIILTFANALSYPLSPSAPSCLPDSNNTLIDTLTYNADPGTDAWITLISEYMKVNLASTYTPFIIAPNGITWGLLVSNSATPFVPAIDPGAGFAQSNYYNLSSPSIGAMPANSTKYLFYNPTSGLYYTDTETPTTPDDLMIVEMTSDGSDINFALGNFPYDTSYSVENASPVLSVAFKLDPVTPGSINVIKKTNPVGSSQIFTFTPSWKSTFTLTDNESNLTSSLAPGNYSITETPVTGWVTSTDIDPSVIVVESGQTTTITFYNAMVVPTDNITLTADYAEGISHDKVKWDEWTYLNDLRLLSNPSKTDAVYVVDILPSGKIIKEDASQYQDYIDGTNYSPIYHYAITAGFAHDVDALNFLYAIVMKIIGQGLLYVSVGKLDDDLTWVTKIDCPSIFLSTNKSQQVTPKFESESYYIMLSAQPLINSSSADTNAYFICSRISLYHAMMYAERPQ